MLTVDGEEEVYRLKPRFAEMLGLSMEHLERDLLDCINAIANESDLKETWIYKIFPPLARQHLKADLCLDFLNTTATMAQKTLGPEPASLASRAEEIVLEWALRGMEIMNDQLNEDGKHWSKLADEITSYEDAVFADDDYKFMWDPAWDGAEHIKGLGTGSLRVKDWFLPFKEGNITNPLTWPEDKKFWHKNWAGFEYPDVN